MDVEFSYVINLRPCDLHRNMALEILKILYHKNNNIGAHPYRYITDHTRSVRYAIIVFIFSNSGNVYALGFRFKIIKFLIFSTLSL